MDIRNITKEDLPKLAELISCGELATRDDISFEHSAVAVDENGNVAAFVITRQRSLQDFFGGRIPDEPSMKEEEDYMEGDEFIFRNELEEHSPEHSQYELLYSYENPSDKYDHIVVRCYDYAKGDIPFIWRECNNEHIVKILDTMGTRRNFNGMVSCDIPFYD
ncbi:MAG: hypothetical protein IKZ54_10465 [Bacteroidales bacterium]|nr:hypothetical protein [Bacteroidales bacterium]